MTTPTFADDLRHLADIVDAHPELDLDMPGTNLVFVNTEQPFAETVRLMAKLGTVAKEHGVTGFTVRLQVNPRFELMALDHLNEVVCERVQTGTAERPIMEQVGTETVPTYEWVCPPSILA